LRKRSSLLKKVIGLSTSPSMRMQESAAVELPKLCKKPCLTHSQLLSINNMFRTTVLTANTSRLLKRQDNALLVVRTHSEKQMISSAASLLALSTHISMMLVIHSLQILATNSSHCKLQVNVKNVCKIQTLLHQFNQIQF